MEARRAPRYGLYGGTFDPVHIGHLTIAQDALDQINLDTLFFVPAAQSPLKAQAPVATEEQRLAMLELSIQGQESFAILDDELKRNDASYTLDTVGALGQRWPKAELFWLIGADQVEQLPHWHRIDELLEQIRFIVVSRPEYQLVLPKGYDPSRFLQLKERQIAISSTQIRADINAGTSAEIFLPPGVSAYIQKHSIYAE